MEKSRSSHTRKKEGYCTVGKKSLATHRKKDPLPSHILAGIPEALISFENDRNIVYFNKGAEKLFGYLPKEVIGKPLALLFPDHLDAANFKAGILARTSRENPTLRDTFPALYGRRKDGSRFSSELSVSTAMNGGRALTTLIVRDATGRDRTDSALRESEQLLRLVLETLPVGVWIADETGRLVMGNPAGQRIWGGARFVGLEQYGEYKGWWAQTGKRIKPEEWALARAISQGESSYNEIVDIEAFDGERKTIRNSAIPLRNSRGEIVGAIVVNEDITSRKRSEEALRETQRVLFTLMSNLPGMAYRCLHDDDWTMEFASEGCLALTGYTPDDLMGNKRVSFQDIIHPDDLADVGGQIDAAIRRKEPFELVYRIITADSQSKWVWEQGCGVYSPDGSLRALEGFITDITEHKRAEEDRERSLSLLRATLESTADGILVVDKESRFASFNKRFVDMWRIPPDIVSSGSDDLALQYVLDQLVNPEGFLTKVRELYSRPDAESYDVLEFQDGRVFERYSQPHKIGETNFGRVWSFRDVTERKRSEEKLLHAQKMEAVGRLAGGVAHDFNNLLTAIMGHSDILMEHISKDDAVRRHLDEIQKSAERAAALTRQLLAFSRKQVVSPRILDLNTILQNMKGMLPRMLGEDIELQAVIAPQPTRIKADPGQIEQVIMNLAVNARDAMPQGGRLVLETSDYVMGGPSSAQYSDGSSERYVLLSVSDAGSGMDSETKAHLFEPFYTTKEVGKGTGLGLSTVFGIVQQCGGHIEVASQLGKGTTFKIYFPRVESEVESPDTDRITTPNRTGTETILLAEDEPSVRRLAYEFLANRGYTVIEASSGLEALERSNQYSGPINLLVTDVVMPGISGSELAAQLHHVRPEMKVLYMSGYTDDAIVHYGVLEAGVDFVAKPFSSDELTFKVRKVLDDG